MTYRGKFEHLALQMLALFDRWFIPFIVTMAVLVMAMAFTNYANAGTAQCRNAEQVGQWVWLYADVQAQVSDRCVLQINPSGIIQPQFSRCDNTPNARVEGSLRITPRCAATLKMLVNGSGLRGECIIDRDRGTMPCLLFSGRRVIGHTIMVKQ